MFQQQQHFDCGSIFARLLFLIIEGKIFDRLICWEPKSSDGYLLWEYQQSVSILWRLSIHPFFKLSVCFISHKTTGTCLIYRTARFLTLGPVKYVSFFPKCWDFSRNKENFNQIIGHGHTMDNSMIFRVNDALCFYWPSLTILSVTPQSWKSSGPINSHSVNYLLPPSHSNIPPPVTSSWTLASLHQVLPQRCSHQPVWTCVFWSRRQGLCRNSGHRTEDWIFTGGCR